ncbi:MAG: nucleoside-diphosphate sugar epimerase/dehydratase [Burkholderiaceae bacterium]|jgi:FlaA1/EpsC-like NDP-sugar epimerase|nr:nucleoside-diphosphate sugar epimerase/dehydratase [Burkholderiaceae bacterium]
MKAAAALGPWHRLDLLLARLRRHREPLTLLVDAAVVALCWNATYLFRLGFERWFAARAGYDAWVMAGVVAAYVLAFWLLRVPKGLWRFSGFGEVQRFALACLLAGGASAAVIMAAGLVKIPRSVLALHPVVTLMGLALVRMSYRMLYEHLRSRIAGPVGEVRRAVVLGAGAAARLLLAGLRAQGWAVLGLLDDDPGKQGAVVGGVPVLGPLHTLPRHAGPGSEGAATHVVVAMPSATRAERRRALDLAAATGLPVLTVPSADELRTGAARIERLRDIEPDDLLGREPVVLDEAGVAAVLQGRTVLVTGAGGSIGSELCRQVARFGPARLVLVELSEFNLYAIEQELAEAHPGLAVLPLIGDVKDAAWMQATLARWRPAAVFHAAAYKHVPLMEGLNAAAALANNVLGSVFTAEAAARAGVERFVLVSTDKAVNPTNVMGASKRAAELAVTALAARHPGTRFMAVRFGNVLGSSGSVIPRFKEQIARGGPVTVTHPDIIRYFMTIPEAARLVLQAGALGDSGQVMVLDMGEPVKIVDLARDLIRLSGHTVDEIAIEFTGLRPGEKLYEELLADTEATLPTPVERLRVARIASGDAAALDAWLAQAQAVGADDAAARALLRRWVPEYRPAADGTARSTDCSA